MRALIAAILSTVMGCVLSATMISQWSTRPPGALKLPTPSRPTQFMLLSNEVIRWQGEKRGGLRTLWLSRRKHFYACLNLNSDCLESDPRGKVPDYRDCHLRLLISVVIWRLNIVQRNGLWRRYNTEPQETSAREVVPAAAGRWTRKKLMPLINNLAQTQAMTCYTLKA